MRKLFAWFCLFVMAGVVQPGWLRAQDAPGLQNMGIYGGTVDRIVGATNNTQTRLYVAVNNPNAVFYADIPHDQGYPFTTNHFRFNAVPGLAAEQNRGTVSHVAVHQPSLRLYANPLQTLHSFSDDPEDDPQIFNDKGAPENAFPSVNALTVHADFVIYALSENLGTDADRTNVFSICLRDINPATGLADTNNANRIKVKLSETEEWSSGYAAELTVGSDNKLYAIVFPNDPHALYGKLLVSTGTVDQISSSDDHTDAFDVQDMPAFVADNWISGATARTPVRLGVGPDNRVFIAGLRDGKIRVAYSDNAGIGWSAEVDTGVQQGALGAQLAFLPDNGSYYVYSSSSVSTNKGEAGTWFHTGYANHAPFKDPHVNDLLYTSYDELGLGYITNALTSDSWTDAEAPGGPRDYLEVDLLSYDYGIEAVQINDFDFTSDKTVGWTASGQGIRWTTNLNADASAVVWSAPIMPAPSPSYGAVAIDPNDPSGARVYAGGNRSIFRAEQGFTESTNAWTRLFNGFQVGEPGSEYDMAEIHRIAVKPGNTNVIVAGFASESHDPNTTNGVMVSTDYGVTWTNLLFSGSRFLDVKDLLFVGDDLFVAAAYNENGPDPNGLGGVWRVDTSDADIGNWTSTHELGAAEPLHVRSLTVDSATNVFAAGLTTNWVMHSYVHDNPALAFARDGAGNWDALPDTGLPENPGAGQPENVFVTVGIDDNLTEALLLTFGRGLYVFRDESWVRIHQYPFQTALQVLKWDELTIGSGSGLYAQETGSLDGTTRYVSLDGAHIAPFDTWANAATNIQAALDVAIGGDIVWVTNGVYNVGGAEAAGLATRAAVPDYVTLRSVNGASNTVIQGAADNGTNGVDAVRGAYVGAYARLQGFTITGGHTDWAEDDEGDDDDESALGGGGVYVRGGLAIDCVITNNSAMLGGGVFIDGEGDGGEPLPAGRVENCRIEDNTAEWMGGGVVMMAEDDDEALVLNCIISRNVAPEAGGVLIEEGGAVVNSLIADNEATGADPTASGVFLMEGGLIESCTIVGNQAVHADSVAVLGEDEENPGDPCGEILNSILWFNVPTNVAAGSIELIEHSCAPELTHGTDGNITNYPGFADVDGNDWRIQVASPCIDTGNNQTWMAEQTDLAGNARIVNGIVDMGTYEFVASSETYYAQGTHVSSLDSTDDGTAGPFPIGFAFPFFGVNTNEFYLTTNGALSFDGAQTTFGNTVLPAGGSYNFPAIFPFWDDLYPNWPDSGLDGHILYQLIPAWEYGNPYGQPVLVAQWTTYGFYGSTLVLGTFQVHLVADGRIIFNYNDIQDSDRARGSEATIGIQASGAGPAIQHSLNTDAGIGSGGTTIRFVPDGGSYDKTGADTTFFWNLMLYKDSPPPAQPDNLQPASGSTNTTALTFSWSETDRATSYRLTYSVNANLSGGTVVETTNTFADVSGLVNETQYYWQVVALGDGGQTPSVLHNLFTMDPEMAVLGSNGVVVADAEAASPEKGTQFGPVPPGGDIIHTLSITNAGGATLALSGWQNTGAGAAQFDIAGIPDTVPPNTAIDLTVTFDSSIEGVHTSLLAIAHNAAGVNSPYRIPLQGLVDAESPVVAGTNETVSVGDGGARFLNLDGTVTDMSDIATMAATTFRDYGEFVANISNGVWRVENIPLYKGPNFIELVTTDEAGNSTTNLIEIDTDDNLYNAMLRSGQLVTEIDFPDNLVPGTVTNIGWSVLSYVPIRGGIWAGVGGDDTWEYFRNGSFAGVTNSNWQINGRRARVYSFTCEWPVPEKSGEFMLAFLHSQMDGALYMSAVIPDDADPLDRTIPGRSKLIARTIVAGGDESDPTGEDPYYVPEREFEFLADYRRRSGGTISEVNMPTNLVADAEATASWKVLSYVPIRSSFQIANISEDTIFTTNVAPHGIEGTRTGSTESDWRFLAGGTVYRATEYTFSANFSVPPEAAGTNQIYFLNQDQSELNSSWMSGNIDAGADPNPVEHNGIKGRFIQRIIE